MNYISCITTKNKHGQGQEVKIAKKILIWSGDGIDSNLQLKKSSRLLISRKLN